MLGGPQILSENLRNVRSRTAAAAAQCGRNVDSVTILAVSKGKPAADVRALAQLGQRDFGENYVQEALPKIAACTDLALVWHFIGQIQANKTRAIAGYFDWVHTVDRIEIGRRLSAQRPHHAPALNVCIQLRIGVDASRAGVAPESTFALAAAIVALPRLRLRGLMCMPPAETDPARQRHWFADARAAFLALRAIHPGLDTLSMGMSADLESAIAEGATLLRIGTALFGPRQ